MARRKQTPTKRTVSSDLMHLPSKEKTKQEEKVNANGNGNANGVNGNHAKSKSESESDSPGLMQLVVCVLGIYASL